MERLKDNMHLTLRAVWWNLLNYVLWDSVEHNFFLIYFRVSCWNHNLCCKDILGAAFMVSLFWARLWSWEHWKQWNSLKQWLVPFCISKLLCCDHCLLLSSQFSWYYLVFSCLCYPPLIFHFAFGSLADVNLKCPWDLIPDLNNWMSYHTTHGGQDGYQVSDPSHAFSTCQCMQNLRSQSQAPPALTNWTCKKRSQLPGRPCLASSKLCIWEAQMQDCLYVAVSLFS